MRGRCLRSEEVADVHMSGFCPLRSLFTESHLLKFLAQIWCRRLAFSLLVSDLLKVH